MARLWLGLDVVAVVVFVAIGRDTHERAGTLAGLADTATPFILAVGAGWLVTRAWRSPASLRTGALIAAVTIVVGLLLRRLVFGDGTAAAFVIVTTVFLSVFIIGWRLAAARLRPRVAV